MPTLNTQTFGQMVRTYAAAVQAAASSAITFAVGSIELALGEASATLAQWLQSLVMMLLSATRLATSQGSDVDSWVGDFGLTRLPAIAATGSVTFSRWTPTLVATIPAGTMVQAGALQFQVIADATQPTFSAGQNAYIIPAGTPAANVTVQCLTAGTVGNVTIGAISTMVSPIIGIDSVANAEPFVTGANAETDAALKARFQLYIQGLRQGVSASVASAIEGLGQGAQYLITENQDFDATPNVGHFYVTIWPNTSTLVNLVYGAIQNVRSLGVTFSVHGAVEVAANVTFNITPTPNQIATVVQNAVQDAIAEFIASLTIGQPLYLTQLYAVIYGVSGVQEATGLQVNGGTADLVPTNQQIVQPGTVTAVVS